MWGFSVAIKSSFLISFSNVGQFGAGRGKYFAALHYCPPIATGTGNACIERLAFKG